MDITTFLVIDDLGRVFGRYRTYRMARRQIVGADGTYADGRQGWRIVEVRD